MKLLIYFLPILGLSSCFSTVQDVTKTPEAKPDITETPIDSATGLIRDCPDELIQNMMPLMTEGTRQPYYIYKGQRKEISDFDSTWVKANCSVKTTVVH